MKFNRRTFLRSMAAGSALYTVPGLFAEQLVLTPEQTIGPYYPDKMPLDKDNDLLIINDAITPAVGTIAWVSGRVLDQNGNPVRGALVEIWQADNNGAYIHTQSPSTNRDKGFQGYGAFITASTGEYLFRTVKPGLYPGRTRHIHFQVTYPGGRKMTTQLYVQGDALNNSDGVLQGIRDTAQRNSVIVPWNAVAGSAIGELSARFDIVLGYTPTEPAAGGGPVVSADSGIVHGAVFQPGIAPGAWIAIFGDNLAPTSRTWDAGTEIVNGKLPGALDGVSVKINNKAAAVNYISPKQINVQAPSDDTTGPVQVTVTTPSGTAAPVTVNMQSILPGFFQYPQSYVAAVRADGALVAPQGLFANATTVPARPGDKLLLYGTGFGPTAPAVASGEVVKQAAPLANMVTVRFDNVTVVVDYAGLTAAGLYQLNVTVPELPDGDHVVTADVAGVRTPSISKIRIQHVF